MINFLNPALLWLGLAGLSLPILAHLLSKKRYDIVDWGAMQFLELRQNARRKILLEQLLLMALRIGLIALVALAFMRPWAEGAGWFSKALNSQSRDVVIIVDGSYSMGWKGKGTTPHQDAVQFAKRFLDDLNAGDSVALIDARDKPRVVMEVPTRNFKKIREELDGMPPPAGKADLALATRKAVQILSRSNNLAREIVVVTDKQAKSWRPDDKALWTTYDDQLNQPAVRPRTWVMEVGAKNAEKQTNFAVSRIKLNREVTAIGYPIRAQAQISASGLKSSIFRKAYLEVDGQRLEGKTVQKKIDAGDQGQATVEFEYAFKEAGSHRISIVLENDNLPGDNRADAVVVVTEAVPALLVDGDPNDQEFIKSETVYINSALTPSENDAPWVKAEAISWKNLNGKLKDLDKYDAVVLANVPRLTDVQLQALQKYVADGGGVFFALGDKIDPKHYGDKLVSQGQGLLPVEPVKIITVDDPKKSVYPLEKSLEVPWMQRFKDKKGNDFTEIRFFKRWATRVVKPKKPASPKKKAKSKTEKPIKIGQPVVAAKYTTLDPLIVTRRYGRGRVVVMTNAIDGDWGTITAKLSYTVLMHEIVFYLASAKSTRNVDVGAPLVLAVPEDKDVTNHRFFGPGETSFKFITGKADKGYKTLRLNETALPGVYAFRKQTKDGKPDLTDSAEYFVVNFDRDESDLTPLKDPQREALAKSNDNDDEARMTFVPNREEMTKAMFKDNSRSEFGWLLLVLFLGLLVFEVVMTKKMVQGGHAVIDDDEMPEIVPEPSANQPPPLKQRGGPPPLQPAGAKAASVVSRGEQEFADETEYAGMR